MNSPLVKKPSKAAEAVRARLKSRRAKSSERPITVPFVVDVELADSVKALIDEKSQLESRLQYVIERVDEAEADPDEDVRADGQDLTPSTSVIASLEASLARVEAEIEEKTDAVREGSVNILFRLATDTEYESHLAEVEREFSEPNESHSVSIGFGNRLLASCFLRVEQNDEDLGYTTWAEFSDDMEMTFGDVDPIRTIIITKNRRSGAFKLPF